MVGNFQLTGIPPAPERSSQIEVAFDIDANGIVHVSAKDLGTGNEQKVTITATSNLSDDEIDKAVKEAEKFAAEDKQKKESIEARNQADSLIYQTEKNLKDLGDKVSAEDKANIETELNHLKEVVKGDDTEAIKAASEKLSQAFYAVSQKMYQQNPGAAGPGGLIERSRSKCWHGRAGMMYTMQITRLSTSDNK